MYDKEREDEARKAWIILHTLAGNYRSIRHNVGINGAAYTLTGWLQDADAAIKAATVHLDAARTCGGAHDADA